MKQHTISRKSPLSGFVHSMTLPISEDEYLAGQRLREKGMLIQHAFPTLSDAEREFVLTGITPAEWDKYLKGDDEPDDMGEQEHAPVRGA